MSNMTGGIVPTAPEPVVSEAPPAELTEADAASAVASTLPGVSIAIVPEDMTDAEAARLLEERAEDEYQKRLREWQYRPPVGAWKYGIDNTKSGGLDVVLPQLARHAWWAVPVCGYVVILPVLFRLGLAAEAGLVLVWMTARRYRRP